MIFCDIANLYEIPGKLLDKSRRYLRSALAAEYVTTNDRRAVYCLSRERRRREGSHRRRKPMEGERSVTWDVARNESGGIRRQRVFRPRAFNALSPIRRAALMNALIDNISPGMRPKDRILVVERAVKKFEIPFKH